MIYNFIVLLIKLTNPINYKETIKCAEFYYYFLFKLIVYLNFQKLFAFTI